MIIQGIRTSIAKKKHTFVILHGFKSYQQTTLVGNELTLFICFSGQLRMHGMEVGHLPVSSPHEVDLKGFDDISGRADYHLVKAHGNYCFRDYSIFFHGIV